VVPDAPFTHRDNEIVVRVFISPNFAVLFENAFEELSATLMSHDNRVKAVRLMLRDSLPRSDNAEYWIVITLNAGVSKKTAEFLTKEVVRWKRKSLKVARKRPRGEFKSCES
jgi:hypothetical protein